MDEGACYFMTISVKQWLSLTKQQRYLLLTGLYSVQRKVVRWSEFALISFSWITILTKMNISSSGISN